MHPDHPRKQEQWLTCPLLTLPCTADIWRQEGIWQSHLNGLTGMLAVIYGFVGKKDVVINTADKKGGERHHKDELPVEKKVAGLKELPF